MRMSGLRLWVAGTALFMLGAHTSTADNKLHAQDPLTKATTSASPANAARTETIRKRTGTRWGADYFPNIPLTTHEGKTVRFFDDLIEDKVVVINFIYTSCKAVCPVETAQLRQVQKLLGDRVGRDIFMYSITIDPERDTPEVLKKYHEKFKIGPGWTFLTGKKEDIDLLRQKLGLYIEEIQEVAEDGAIDHNTNLVIGNQATGRWMKRSPYEDSHVLASMIGDWLHNWSKARKKKKSYEDAPEITSISKTDGDYLFRTRCVSCHTIGGGDRIGPDLSGVTRRRDRAWLARWIAEPDKMLAEKDPVAMALFAQYNDIQMPNLALTSVDVDNLLTYLQNLDLSVANDKSVKQNK